MIKKTNYKLINSDCLKWMKLQKKKSVDCVITSPPYNLNIKYSNYKDNIPRENYLNWLSDVSDQILNILKDKGHFFLNVGSSNADPYISMDVCSVFRKNFVLQNNFVW